tara:strand:- start:70 stop:285 length:216 start_codon:yes stop_codon:yes gene_type:complete
MFEYMMTRGQGIILISLAFLIFTVCIYFFCKRCKKDQVMIRDLISNPRIVPAGIIVDGQINNEPYVPELPK